MGSEGMGDGVESNLIGSLEQDMRVCVCVQSTFQKMSTVVLNIIISCIYIPAIQQ